MSRLALLGRPRTMLRQFLDSGSFGGILLMGVALLALVTANSPLAPLYFGTLSTYVGPLSILHWVNDALMAVFFLLVGLEIKREFLDGGLATWPRRFLPGGAAIGGMVAPALIYLSLNYSNPAAARGWAIPAATDIAFALGVLSLLGTRVPASLKVFLAALAIIDDLGAVVIIALFYTASLNVYALLAAAFVVSILRALNNFGYDRLPLYLLFGVLLWILVFLSGVHATVAGVILALTIPIRLTPATPEALPAASPLHRLEGALHRPVALLIVPIFGFANAGVSFSGVSPSVLLEPLSLGVAGGLVLGKLLGVFGTVSIMVRSGLTDLPAGASWGQVFGVALLCGIGFTMSLFIGLLAFDDPAMQDRMKFGILAGSALAGIGGYVVLRTTKREIPASPSIEDRS